MKIVSIRPAKNLIASSVAGRPRGDPYEGPAGAFFTGRELSEAVCGLRTAKVQVTSPALRATSSSALRFGNRPALSCGQHLTGQKGPNMGGLGSPIVFSLRGRISRRLGGRLWSGIGFSSACSGLRR